MEGGRIVNALHKGHKAEKTQSKSTKRCACQVSPSHSIVHLWVATSYYPSWFNIGRTSLTFTRQNTSEVNEWQKRPFLQPTVALTGVAAGAQHKLRRVPRVRVHRHAIRCLVHLGGRDRQRRPDWLLLWRPMKLYGFPPTRTIRALWMLRELDLDFEYV